MKNHRGIRQWSRLLRQTIRRQERRHCFDHHYNRGARHGFMHLIGRAPTTYGAHKRYMTGYARGLWEHTRMRRHHRMLVVTVKEFPQVCGCVVNAHPNGYWQTSWDCRYRYRRNHHMDRTIARITKQYTLVGPLMRHILGIMAGRG